MKINVPNVCGEEKTSSSFGIPNKASVTAKDMAVV